MDKHFHGVGDYSTDDQIEHIAEQYIVHLLVNISFILVQNPNEND